MTSISAPSPYYITSSGVVPNPVHSTIIAIEKGKTMIWAILATIIGSIIVVYSIYSIIKTNSMPETDAVVERSSCSTSLDKTRSIKCNITLNYTINNISYKYQTYTNEPYYYEVGQVVRVKYNPSKPEEAYMKSSMLLDIVLILIVICIVCSTWIKWKYM